MTLASRFGLKLSLPFTRKAILVDRYNGIFAYGYSLVLDVSIWPHKDEAAKFEYWTLRVLILARSDISNHHGTEHLHSKGRT